MSTDKNNSGTKNYTRKTFPDCRGWSAFVLGGAFYGDVIELMAEAGFEKAANVKDADVIVFIGGADINPSLYGQKKHPTTCFSDARDLYEKAVYEEALKLGKPMFGICRGAQFLHAMNDGELWQDVNHHGGLPHKIVDIEDDVRVLATSVHHQMLKDNDNLCVIAVTEEEIASRFSDDKQSIIISPNKKNDEHPLEIEAGCYLETGCFFVQGHPEIGIPEYRSWAMWKLYHFLVEWELQQADPSKELEGLEQAAEELDNTIAQLS